MIPYRATALHHRQNLASLKAIGSSGKCAALFLLTLHATFGAYATVWPVGPGKPHQKPSQVSGLVQDGDTVLIDAGTYAGDVAFWKADGLLLKGEGGMAHLDADGKSAGQKAIWVIQGDNCTVEWIEFSECQVPDHNGAGIRAEHRSGELRVLNSGFYDNQNGILSAAGPVGITIDGSEFARSETGTLAALGHNLYIGRIDRLTVRSSFFHEAVRGHNLKSRARVSLIESSYFMDGPSGRSSYLTDFPDGGQVMLRGNLLHKGPLAENPTAIAYGAESMAAWPTNTLALSHNTVVMTRSGGFFLRAPASTPSLRLTANVWAGTGSPGLITGGYAIANAAQADNRTAAATAFPDADHLFAPSFWPTAAAHCSQQMSTHCRPPVAAAHTSPSSATLTDPPPWPTPPPATGCAPVT